MKFGVNATRFEEALFPALQVATKNLPADCKSDNGIYHVILRAEESHLIVTAGGHNTICHSVIPGEEGYQLVVPGTVCVDIVNLYKLVASYPPGSVIELALKGRELYLKTIGNPSEIQILATIDIDYEPVIYESPDTFKMLFTVNNKIFLKGMNKVHYAIGLEDSRPDFNRQWCQVRNNQLRFVSGTGARFAVMDYMGHDIVTLAEETEVFFPSYSITNLLRCIKKAYCNEITIRTMSGTSSNGQHLVACYDNTEIIIFQDGQFAIPPVEKILDREYDYKFQCRLGDLKYAVAGVLATKTIQHEEVSPRHNTMLDVNLVRGVINILSFTNVTSKRCLPIVNVLVQGDKSKPMVRANSKYLVEVIQKGPKSEDTLITVSFNHQDENSDVPPILVEYPAVMSQRSEITEQFYMLFSVAL